MSAHKQPSRIVTVALCIAVSAVVIAGLAVCYIVFGHHLGPRGAVVGLAAVLLANIASLVVLRLRGARGKALAALALAATGATAYFTAWALRIAPEAIASFEFGVVADAATAVVQRGASTELVLILAAELGIVIAMTVSLSRAFNQRECNWCSSLVVVEHDVARRADAAGTELRTRLQSANWDWFRKLGAPRHGARSWVQIDLGSCTCGLTRTVWATRVRRLGLNKPIVRDLRQKPEDVRAIRNFELPDTPELFVESKDETLDWFENHTMA